MNYKLNMKNARGFTLIELMVALAIFAIITMLDFPGFQLYQQNSARVTNINDLVSALNMARSEAAKRSVQVIVCASTDQATCSGVDDWTTGWIAFVDADNNNAVSAGDTTILIHAALSGANVTFHDFDGITPLVTYSGTGRATPTASFMRCDNRFNTDAVPDQHARAVIVTASGRIRLSRNDDNDANNIHEGLNGTLACP